MRSLRSFLSVARIDGNSRAALTVGKYLRYIHYRDAVQRDERGQGVAGLARYVAYREQASAEARLFTANSTATEQQRRALLAYVRRSIREASAEAAARQGRWPTAAYRMVLSPEDAHRLDLRTLARQTIKQLEVDTGAKLPWIAAEHRNTDHPHVHILMAARKEFAPSQFRGVRITRERLARMKDALTHEIRLQRGDRPLGLAFDQNLSRPFARRARPERPVRDEPHSRVGDPLRWRPARGRHRAHGLSWYPMSLAFARLAAHYRREMEREEREERRRWSRERHEEREWEVYE